MKIFLVIIILLKYHLVFSSTYEAEMDHAGWEYSSSPFKCKIEQKIQGVGNIYFIKESGKSMEFHLDQIFLDEGKNLKILSGPPSWRSDHDESKSLKTLIDKKNFSKFNKSIAKKLLFELSRGNSPKIQWDIEFNGQVSETLKISLSPISFQDNFKKYLKCLDRQLPISFTEISHSKIFFTSNDYSLSIEAKQWLSTLIKSLLIIPDYKKIMIDGHTDATHNSYHNKKLSKKRAESVRDYLLSHGIPIEKLIINYYGENSPLADNSTTVGRSVNRRVSIDVSL